METKPQTPPAHLKTAGATVGVSIGVVPEVSRAGDTKLLGSIGELRLTKEHDSSYGTIAVAYRLRTLHNLYISSTGMIDLRSMIRAPALTVESHPIVEQ